MDKQAKLQSLKKHNTAIYKGDRTGTIVEQNKIIDIYQETLSDFAKEVIETRQGRVEDKYGRKLAANDVSLASALEFYYGIVAPDRVAGGRYLSAKEKEFYVINQFLRQNDVSMGTDSLFTLGQRFGHDNLTAGEVTSLLTNHSAFDAVNNTTQISGDFRFIIPELILAAIRLDYDASSMHQNWIGNTLNITNKKVVMPNIQRGNSGVKKLGQSESIPFGTVRFGQKEASVYKVGTGFKITDELVEESSLNMIFEFLGEVGTDMSIGADVEAHTILMNGEQGDGSESAPIIGVDTTTQFKFKDIKRAVSRMGRLKRNVSRIITGENDGIDLSLLDEYKGFAGDKTLGNLSSILGVPASMANDVWNMPANQILLLDPANAMVKLNYRSMKTETRRNPQNQEDEIFVSQYVGFAIKRRDARLILDKSLAFSGNGFPSYMDIDARISEAFKHKNA